jgi:hypothetical protein
MGVIPVTLCETHSATFASCKDKKLEELPDELLSAQLTRLTYLRELDVKHANEALQAGANRGKLNTLGEALSIISGANGAANWYQLEAMNKNAMANSQSQMFMNDANSLDTKIANVKSVMDDRKRKVEQPQRNSSEHSSDDPIAILKVRFAKGEIDKNQYEEALKLITADAT